MQKSDKVKSSPFIELLSDMSALGVANLMNYVAKENPTLFTPLPGGESYRPSRSDADKLLLAAQGVTISNVSARYLPTQA